MNEGKVVSTSLLVTANLVCNYVRMDSCFYVSIDGAVHGLSQNPAYGISRSINATVSNVHTTTEQVRLVLLMLKLTNNSNFTLCRKKLSSRVSSMTMFQCQYQLKHRQILRDYLHKETYFFTVASCSMFFFCHKKWSYNGWKDAHPE